MFGCQVFYNTIVLRLQPWTSGPVTAVADPGFFEPCYLYMGMELV